MQRVQDEATTNFLDTRQYLIKHLILRLNALGYTIITKTINAFKLVHNIPPQQCIAYGLCQRTTNCFFYKNVLV